MLIEIGVTASRDLCCDFPRESSRRESTFILVCGNSENDYWRHCSTKLTVDSHRFLSEPSPEDICLPSMRLSGFAAA
jgi:hypothetical protein